VAAALERRKGAWFLQGASVAGELVQHCVLPRALQSPADARYTARFLLLLHASATPFFSTLMVLDNVRPGAAPARPPRAPPRARKPLGRSGAPAARRTPLPCLAPVVPSNPVWIWEHAECVCCSTSVHDSYVPVGGRAATARARPQVFNKLVHIVPCCTEREAENMGVFMLELFRAIESWRVRP